MKDFDAARQQRIKPAEERTFRLMGETFMLKASMRPEAFLDFATVQVNPDPTPAESLELVKRMDGIVESFLVKEDREKWRRLRGDERDDEVSTDDMQAILEWATEVIVGRPTAPPSPSPTPQVNGGTSSTPGSSPPAAAVPATSIYGNL